MKIIYILLLPAYIIFGWWTGILIRIFIPSLNLSYFIMIGILLGLLASLFTYFCYLYGARKEEELRELERADGYDSY